MSQADSENNFAVFCRRSKPVTEPKLFSEDSLKAAVPEEEEEKETTTNVKGEGADDEDFFFNMFKPAADSVNANMDVKSDQTNYDTEEWMDDITEDFNELNLTKAVFTPIKFVPEVVMVEPITKDKKVPSKVVDEAALNKLRDHKKKLNTELLTMGFT